MEKLTNIDQFEFSFGSDFLKQHAGQIVTDQNYAIIELVANCWDAGSSEVKILWPENGGKLSIKDDGIGMSKSELFYRWGKLNYNRLQEQGGSRVVFPFTRTKSNRKVFGRNGVGRHALFCFNNEYEIKTFKNGEFTHIKVKRSVTSDKPFIVEIIENNNVDSSFHGTEVITNIDSEYIKLINTSKLIELIGSRFISDPEFKVYVNEVPVKMTDIDHLTQSKQLTIDNINVKVQRIYGEKGKNTKQNGIAWWYNNRLVGDVSWFSFEYNLIDGRHPIAKKLLYIVIADNIDEKSVKKDWSGFYQNEQVIKVQRKVYEYIKDDLRDLLYETRKERRLQVYVTNKQQLSSLTPDAKQNIVEFLENVQSKCPTIGISELETVVEVLAKLEKSRSGYELLEKISFLNENEIDSLNTILEEWTIDDAKKVLGELKWRLELVSKLEEILQDSKAKELQDLQPLFERGLWIFGPEFESISFMSNRSLSTVIKDLLKDDDVDSNNKRPDFVILPDSTIGVYSCDNFNENHEPIEFSKIVIVELKRVGIAIDDKQKDQALYYARSIKKSKKISPNADIIAYVLGSEIEPDAIDEFKEGNIKIVPMRYNVILAKAHSRTFSLIKRIEELKPISYSTEIDEIVGSFQLQIPETLD